MVAPPAPLADDATETGDDGATHAFWSWLTRRRGRPPDLDDVATVRAILDEYEADR